MAAIEEEFGTETPEAKDDGEGWRAWARALALLRGRHVRFRARAGLGLAIFFSVAVLALVPASGLRAADGLCPREGGTSGRVVAVDERLELTLENGIRLKIAGVDPPRPTPGNPDLDIRARDGSLNGSLDKKYGFARSNPARIDGGAWLPSSSPSRRSCQMARDRRACRSARRSSMPASRAMNQARRRVRAGAPFSPRRPGHGLPGLAFGPIRTMRHRCGRSPVFRGEGWLDPSLSKAGLPGSPAGGRA